MRNINNLKKALAFLTAAGTMLLIWQDAVKPLIQTRQTQKVQ